MTTDSRLGVIRGLLAKAEATSFPAEAEVFTAKASELMARYAIDEALIWSTSADPGLPSERTVVLQRPYVSQKAYLVHRVAGVFGCSAIRLMGGAGASTEPVSVVGYESDLDLVETMVTSLLVQAAQAMVVDQPAGLTSSGAAAFRRSHLMGFIETACARLADVHRDAVVRNAPPGRAGDDSVDLRAQPAGPPSLALVLADRSESVDAEFSRRYPRVRSSRISFGSSLDGHRSGRAAGERADLGSTRLGHRDQIGAAGDPC